MGFQLPPSTSICLPTLSLPQDVLLLHSWSEPMFDFEVSDVSRGFNCKLVSPPINNVVLTLIAWSFSYSLSPASILLAIWAYCFVQLSNLQQETLSGAYFNREFWTAQAARTSFVPTNLNIAVPHFTNTVPDSDEVDKVLVNWRGGILLLDLRCEPNLTRQASPEHYLLKGSFRTFPIHWHKNHCESCHVILH